MAIRSDMRNAGGLLAAPVAIAMLDTAGIAVDSHWQLALTRAEVHLSPSAGRISRLTTQGVLNRKARTQVFTEARFVDTDDPGHVIGLGTADWSVVADTPSGFAYIDPGHGVADEDLPPLASAYDAEPLPGGGFKIASLTPRLGGVVLHHGPILVTLEAAAMQTTIPEARVESLSLRIIRAGKHGPFTATANIIYAESCAVLVRAEMRQADDSVVAEATIRLDLH